VYDKSIDDIFHNIKLNSDNNKVIINLTMELYFEAVRQNDIEFIRKNIKTIDYKKKENGKSIMRIIIEYNQIDIFKLILKLNSYIAHNYIHKNLRINSIVLYELNYCINNEPIIEYIFKNNLTDFALELFKYTNINVNDAAFTLNNNTMLMYCVGNSNLELCLYLYNYSIICVNNKNNQQRTAVQIAAMIDRPDILKFLLYQVNIKYDIYNLIEIATNYKCYYNLNFLINFNKKINDANKMFDELFINDTSNRDMSYELPKNYKYDIESESESESESEIGSEFESETEIEADSDTDIEMDTHMRYIYNKNNYESEYESEYEWEF
jgi:hypothetical protein